MLTKCKGYKDYHGYARPRCGAGKGCIACWEKRREVLRAEIECLEGKLIKNLEALREVARFLEEEDNG